MAAIRNAFIAIVFAGFAMYYVAGPPGEGARQLPPSDGSSSRRASDSVTISIVAARQIKEDFEANEVAARGKYAGKVYVAGIIERIGMNVFDEPYVMLDGGVQCAYSKGEVNHLAALKRGHDYVCGCEAARQIIGTVYLSKCSFSIK